MAKETKLDSLDRTEDITSEEVKALNTFKDWNEERILELINTLKTFSEVMYSNWSKGKEFGKEIVLNNDNLIEIKTAA
jgi:hypothetical protein